jgi:hypothetical protein
VGRPWRERVLTALLVVAVAVPVGVVIGGGLDLRGPDEEVLDVVATADADTTTTSSTSTTAAPTTTTTPARPVAEVRVRLANGSHTAGAAVTVGRRLDDLGYDVLAPAPSPADPVARTTVSYREGFAAEAAAVAVALGLDPSIAAPSAGAASGGGEADVVVVVGDDALAP